MKLNSMILLEKTFEIVEFDEDVIIFFDENEQTYEHDIVQKIADLIVCFLFQVKMKKTKYKSRTPPNYFSVILF